MFFILNLFLSGNLALCGAISNLRADKWRIKLKEIVLQESIWCVFDRYIYLRHVSSNSIGHWYMSSSNCWEVLPCYSAIDKVVVNFFLLCTYEHTPCLFNKTVKKNKFKVMVFIKPNLTSLINFCALQHLFVFSVCGEWRLLYGHIGTV